MTINYHAVGNRIRAYRLDKGITQEELAFRVNTSSAYISNIENAKKRPSLSDLQQHLLYTWLILRFSYITFLTGISGFCIFKRAYLATNGL